MVVPESLLHNWSHVTFDYAALTTRCFTLTDDFPAAETDKETLVTRRRHCASASGLAYEIIYEILWEAVATESKGLSKEGKFLHKAGQAIRSLAQSSGNEYRRIAFNLSSGHKPDDTKPEHLYHARIGITTAPKPDETLYTTRIWLHPDGGKKAGHVGEEELQVIEAGGRQK